MTDHALLRALVRLAAREPVVVCTVVATKGSTPRKPGAKMLVTKDGLAAGTIGGGRIEHEIVTAAKAELGAARPKVVRFHLTHELAMCCGGEMEILLEPVNPPRRVVLFGAGHIHEALTPMLAACDAEVTVVDDLEELASKERFPRATELVHDWDPRRAGVRDGDVVIVATRDHAVDQEILEGIAKLGVGLAFVGVVGSRGKWGRFEKRLAAKGVDEAWLARVRCPVGLAVGAESPGEIAVAIAAELVGVWTRAGAPTKP